MRFCGPHVSLNLQVSSTRESTSPQGLWAPQTGSERGVSLELHRTHCLQLQNWHPLGVTCTMMMMVMFWKTNVGSSRSHPISSCSSYISNVNHTVDSGVAIQIFPSWCGLSLLCTCFKQLSATTAGETRGIALEARRRITSTKTRKIIGVTRLLESRGPLFWSAC